MIKLFYNSGKENWDKREGFLAGSSEPCSFLSAEVGKLMPALPSTSLPSTSFSFLSSSSSSFLTSNSFPAAVTSSTSEARSASCPPQTGFNAFAFLAFILIAIDTIMNINNNINNNNNNNNNNDRNNNNNNNFEAMNMNSRSFKENNICPEVIPASLRLIDSCVKTQVASAEALLSNGSSPWSPEVWTALAGGVQQTSLVGQCFYQTQARGVVWVWCEGGWRP